MKLSLARWRARQPASDEHASEQERRRDVKELEKAERDARRRRAAQHRRQVAGELATAALAWGANAWLEACMWVCMVLGLAVDYIASYADLAATFYAFGYPSPLNWLMPLGLDLPLTSSVLGQVQAGRWKCGRWVRVRLGFLTAATAPLTLIGNALRGYIGRDGHFIASKFQPDWWMSLLAFAVPGVGVVLIAYIASMMQAEKADLRRRELEGELAAGELEPTVRNEEPAPPIETGREPGPERNSDPNRIARTPARVEVRRLVKRNGHVVSPELVARRTGVSVPHARKLLREERRLHLVSEAVASKEEGER